MLIWHKARLRLKKRAFGAAAARSLHMRKVTGSNPVMPTPLEDCYICYDIQYSVVSIVYIISNCIYIL